MQNSGKPTSFNSVGPNPVTQMMGLHSNPVGTGTTPYSKALGNAGDLSTPQGRQNNPATSWMFPRAPQQINQTVKSSTYTDPHGAITKHDYYDNKTGALTAEGTAAGQPDVNAKKTNPGLINNAGVTGGYTNQQNQDAQSQGIANDAAQKQRDDATAAKTQQPPIDAGTSNNPQTNAYLGYSNIIGNSYNSPYNKTAQGSIQGLINTTQGNQQYQDKASQIGDELGQQLADIGERGARLQAGHSAKGTLPVASGHAAIAANTTANLEQAKIAEANQRLAANSQGLTGQSQQQSGYNSAASQGFTGQGQQQTALTTAAGLVSPSALNATLSPSSTIYNQATGQALVGLNAPGTAGNTAYQTAYKQALENVRQGKMSIDDAAASLGQFSVPGVKNSLTADMGSGFNADVSNAQGQTRSAFTKLYNEGSAKLKAANTLEDGIASYLTSNPKLNQTPVSAITNIAQWFAGQASQPEQQVLAQKVKSYIDTLGMSPDDAAQIAIQQGGTIGTLLKNIKDNFSAQNEAYNPAQFNNSSSGGASSGESYTSKTGQSYTLPKNLK